MMHEFLRRAFHCWAAAISLLAASTVLLEAQQRDRAVVPDQYKWDLTALYPSDAAWRSAKQKLAAEIPELREFPGTLASSPQRLADCLVTQSRLRKQLARLDAYAGFISDQDTRVSAYQGMQQEIVQLSAMLDAEAAFIKPEILKIDTAKLEQFISQEPRLLVYQHYLYDVSRRRSHTLSDSEEKLLAASTVMRAGPDSTYSIFSNAELPYPTVALSDGKGVKINQTAYSQQRESPS
jgi:oligoendopeptidase F